MPRFRAVYRVTCWDFSQEYAASKHIPFAENHDFDMDEDTDDQAVYSKALDLVKPITDRENVASATLEELIELKLEMRPTWVEARKVKPYQTPKELQVQ